MSRAPLADMADPDEGVRMGAGRQSQQTRAHPWLSEGATPTAEQTMYALMAMLHRIGRVFDAFLAQEDMPIKLSGPRLRLFLTVHDAGRMRMGDLAAKLGITPRTVTTLVDALERAGLLTRQPDPTDRRATLLELTPKAREHFERVHAIQQEMSEKIMGALDADQRRQLYGLLARLNATLGGESADCLFAGDTFAGDRG